MKNGNENPCMIDKKSVFVLYKTVIREYSYIPSHLYITATNLLYQCEAR